jgi:hypothetical protein
MDKIEAVLIPNNKDYLILFMQCKMAKLYLFNDFSFFS